MKNYNLEDIEEKSEIYEELMSEPPKFYLRSGFSIIALFLIIVVAICYFIDYSSYISSEVKIVSTNSRAPLIAPINGRIVNLISNNAIIKKNDLIAEIENTAKLNDVLFIEKEINKINHDNIKNDITDFKSDLSLGEIQNSFTSYLKAKKELEIYYNFQSNKGKSENLKRELSQGDILIKNLSKEKEILIEKVKLSQSQLDRNKVLLEKGVISLNEYEVVKQKHIDVINSYQIKISQINQGMINNQKIISAISSTQNEDNELEVRILTNVETTLSQLKIDIEQWRKKYLIMSPIDGVLTLNGIWTNQQVVESGQEIGSIVPEKEELFAIAKMPELESGKVYKESDVLIHLNSYNFSEYGIIKGKIREISPVPIEGFYSVEIELPERLTTDLGHSIPFTPELSGEARLITDKMNLLERLFYKVKKLFSRKKRITENQNKNA